MESDFLLVEILYFSGCPSWKQTIDDLKFVLTEKGFKPEIKLIKIVSDDDAKKQEFLGSPTIRVNGRDLFPLDQQNYSLQCRVYPTPEGLKGTPSREMLYERLSKLTN